VIWLAVPALAAAVYYLLALVAAARWKNQIARVPTANPQPLTPISILKPIHGRDPNLYAALRSHALQDYPDYEMLFGVSEADDPALADISRLRREFPSRQISVHVVPTTAPNAKVGVLAELSRQARHSLLLVNDSDIVVEPDYLRTVAAPLENPKVGLVTCLYRAIAESWPSHAEALGIATEFAPSVLVARLLGQTEFALGSTMVFRADALWKFGGFDAIASYLADDYQLGAHIHAMGYEIEFAPVVVETDLGAESWTQTWRHQLRWSRTIRISRPLGYFGYIITHATLWAAVALAFGHWWTAAMVFGIRMAAGLTVGRGILGDRNVTRLFWMIPLRDLFGFAVWLGGLFGSQVQWRDHRLHLESGGKIRDMQPRAEAAVSADR